MNVARHQIEQGLEANALRVHAVLWNSLGRGSVAYTVNELLENMPARKVERNLWCLSRDPEFPRDFHQPALPHLFYRVLCRVHATPATQFALARRKVLRAVRPGDIVYVWPSYDIELIKRAQDLGAIVVAERINCMGGMVRSVLSAAYARRGLSLPAGWSTPDAIAEERNQVGECNYVTAPNPLVEQSIRDSGIPQHRILQTSYGFNPSRLAKAIGIQRPSRLPVFAFVGLGVVRKGLDVLLEAWEHAGVRGKLLIAGTIDDELRRAYAHTLARPDVEQLGYVPDVANVYAAADVFVFPTHEEGGPQVTYEAAACGLPSIVSAMGAGRIIRHEQEGIVIDPLSVDEVAQAISTLAGDQELRQTLGDNAASRAQEFTWSKVGDRLYELFRGLTEQRLPDAGETAFG